MEWGPKFQAEVRSKSERKDYRLAREERASSQASTLTLAPEPLACQGLPTVFIDEGIYMFIICEGPGIYQATS